MVKKTSPLAGMLSEAVDPIATVSFKQGVAQPVKKGPPPKKGSGGGRGNLANFRGKHAAPFSKKAY
jgi:hypothetical protein